MRRYVGLDWGQVHVRESGAGEISLTLLHKVTSSSRMWEPVLGEFADRGYHVIAPDLPGYGLSDVPPLEPSLDWYARIVADVIESFGHRSSWLIGHHTGASVALQLAVTNPERVQGLVLWGVPFFTPEAALRFANEAEPNYQPDGTDVMNWWKWHYQSSSGAVAEAVAMRAVGDLMLCGKARPLGHRALGRVDHEPLLRKINHPTLAIAHARDVVVIETRRAAALLRNCEYVEHETGYPSLVDEDPDGFAELIHAYVSKHIGPATIGQQSRIRTERSRH